LNGTSKPGGLPIESCLLQRIYGVPDQPLKPLSFNFPLRDDRIVARPLSNQCPRSTIFIERTN